MISYVQHVLVRVGQSEEGWLDEGLSKYAEELAGRSYLPGDTAKFSQYAIGDVYDAYQYLRATGTSPLLIEFDQGTLAEVGASWLFVRYLVDQYGAALPGKLDQTTLSGAVNVAAQRGTPSTRPSPPGPPPTGCPTCPGSPHRPSSRSPRCNFG